MCYIKAFSNSPHRLSSHYRWGSELVTYLYFSGFLLLHLCSLAESRHFLFPVAGCRQGKPASSSWNSPSPKGSQGQTGQPECSKHSRWAVYRKLTASLLYSASIKGNSAEDFLEGVMKPTHTLTAPTSTPFHSQTETSCTNAHGQTKIYTHGLSSQPSTATSLIMGLEV